MGRVHVIGNAGLDLTLRLPRLPRAGETLLGEGASRTPGGKGLNQAVAAVRTGIATLFTAPVGVDADGDMIEGLLAAEGFASLTLHRLPHPTDFSLLMVLPGGESSIASSGPCAAAFGADAAMHAAKCTTSGDVVLLQGNLGAEATIAALEVARFRGATTILNPAPTWWDVGPALPRCAMAVVNRNEASDISGDPDPAHAAEALQRRGVPRVIVTLGSDGCLVADDDGVRRFEAARVATHDTTGCGDAFCGTLAAQLAAGRSLDESITFAQRAAALTATRVGAYAALPTRAELAALHPQPAMSA